MNTLHAIRQRLQEIAATASTAAQALDAATVDFLPAELDRLLSGLDATAGRLEGLCETLAVGVDPRR